MSMSIYQRLIHQLRSVYKTDYHTFTDHERAVSNLRQFMVDRNREDHVGHIGIGYAMETQSQAAYQPWSVRSSKTAASRHAAVGDSHHRPFAYLECLKSTGDTQYGMDCALVLSSSRVQREGSKRRICSDTFSTIQGGVPRSLTPRRRKHRSTHTKPNVT